ncbi:MAG: hypothetical protein PW792_03790 [Acidobacteriaceae bacterium]|nr:hypothetical protein [Acidobacteriaceae bacterium]
MNTHSEDDGHEVDPGEPVKELAGFEYDTSATLLGKVRRAIGRRVVMAQVTSFAFEMPSSVLKEFGSVLIESLSANGTKKDN